MKQFLASFEQIRPAPRRGAETVPESDNIGTIRLPRVPVPLCTRAPVSRRGPCPSPIKGARIDQQPANLGLASMGCTLILARNRKVRVRRVAGVTEE